MKDKHLEAAVQQTLEVIRRFSKEPSLMNYYTSVLNRLGEHGAMESIKNLGYIARSHYNALKASQSRIYD